MPKSCLRVLLIEDDPKVRDALRQSLAAADDDIQIVTAMRPDAPLHAQPFDLVVLGVSRPVDTDELAHQIKQLMRELDVMKVQGVFHPNRGNDLRHNKLAVRKGERTVFISASEIHFLSACHKQTYAHTSEDSFIIDMTLSKFEERFSHDVFMRVHRSYIVNLNRIKEVLRTNSKDSSSSCLIIVDDRDETQIPVARRKAQQLREAVGI